MTRRAEAEVNAYLLNLDRAMARLAHMRAELAISALSVYAATLAGALVFGGTAMLAPGAPRDLTRT